MNKKTLAFTLTALAIVSVFSSFYLTQRSPKRELRPDEALGATTAEETARLIGNQGQVVLLVADPADYNLPTAELNAEAKAFRKSLQRNKGLKLVATEKIKLISTPFLPGLSMAPGQLSKILPRYANANALVSFTGFSQLSNEDLNALKASRPKIILVCEYWPGCRELLAKKLIHLAILRRWESTPESAQPPQTVREWFDQYYTVYTPDQAGQLPAQ